MISERAIVSMVVAAALVAALIVAPAAAARTITATGANVFVGEEDLSFTAVPAGETIMQWVHYSDPTAGTIDKTIMATNGVITELNKGIPTGSYYVFTDAATADPANWFTAAGYVNVQVPDVMLDVVLDASRKDSVDGKSVTRDNDLNFKLMNNLNGYLGTMNIEVILPGGGVTTQFGGQALSGIPVNGQAVYIGPISLANDAAGTYVAQAKWPRSTDFYGKGYDSNSVTFEVVTRTLSITANKDSVVRGNSFIVTVNGELRKQYRLFVKDAGIAASEYPVIAPGQIGVMSTGSPTDVAITTTEAGSRSVQFNTNQTTDDRTFTIRVEAPGVPSTYDEVVVRVEKGEVTITASGTGIYATGEEITLSGTNTDSDYVYLFLTGLNLATNGVKLDDLNVAVVDNNPTTFTVEPVEADDIWSYKWDTSNLGRAVDSGGYTIYAVSQPRGKDWLSGVQYSTLTLQLRPPTLTARGSGTTLVPGEEFRISGTATGAPDSVLIWIFSPDYRALGQYALVEGDGTFEYVLEGSTTEGFVQKGQYYVVVQHPMDMGYGIHANASGYLIAPGTTPIDLTRLQASDAVNALVSALESGYVDDIYTKFSFTVVEESWIWFDWIDDLAYGETVTVTGDTSYPAGTLLTYRITTQESGVRVLSGEVAVADGGGWSFDVDTTTIGPGSYVVRVTSPDGQTSVTMPMGVCDNIIHPTTPTGATYRIESIQMNPSLNELSFSESLTLVGAIAAPWTGYQGSLEFFTDLDDPVWSFSIERDGVVIYHDQKKARYLSLSAFELDYGRDVRLLISLAGIVPEAGVEAPTLFGVLERDARGGAVPASEYRLLFTPDSGDPIPPSSGSLALSPGWNFVSVPRPLAAGNDTAAIFAAVETGGRSALRYNTAAGGWTALEEEDRIGPLEGVWIYSTGPEAVPLNFSTALPVPPAERALSGGWNAVGVTSTIPATARDTFYSVNAQWTTLIGFDAGTQAFETAIINGGSGGNVDSRAVYPGRGYWLHMTGPGTLCAVGA